MIEPTKRDFGKRVIYQPHPAHREAGMILHWNDQYVFVLYDGDLHAKATRRADLSWAGEVVDFKGETDQDT